MDWIRGIQRAIDYIENHITEELDYAVIAEQAYFSSFHFQRTFNLLTDITIGEYIRNRRLSLAGEELLVTSGKVIDIALKYGYDTPESFTKAFTRFHGVTPSGAHKDGTRLKSYNRLSISITMKGGSIMEYQMIRRESFTVLVKAKGFPIGEANNLVPNYWTECYSDDTMKTLCSYGQKNELLGLCQPEKKGEKTFQYGIGIECTKDTVPPKDYELWTVPAQTWAVFKCIGAVPTSIHELNKRIYADFFPSSDYEPADAIDFELYPEGDNSRNDYSCEIWIPVKRKAE